MREVGFTFSLRPPLGCDKDIFESTSDLLQCIVGAESLIVVLSRLD